MVVTPEAYAFEVKNFVAEMMKSARNFQLSEPRYVEIEESTPECFASGEMHGSIVIQGRRPEIFTRVMKKCYSENAVPCQVITDKYFSSEDSTQVDIATKVAISNLS